MSASESRSTAMVPRGPGHCDDDAAWINFVGLYAGQPRSRPDLTDFALANAVFLADRNDLDLIVYQTAAKERIRWLSIELAKAKASGERLAAKPLDWRKPTKRDRDEGVGEGALWIAPGFGGEYAIQSDLQNFILWRVDEPYAFDSFPTVDDAKAHAEADWQRTIGRKLAPHQSPHSAADADKVRKEIKAWADTRWPKSHGIGSKGWVDGLTNRVLAALKSTAKGQAEP